MPKNTAPRIDFAAIKRAVPMTQVLEHYELLEELEEKEDGYKGRCPFHEGKSRTPFHVSTSKNLWYCHGPCKRGGNVLDFVATIEELSIREAAELLANRCGISGGQQADKKANDSERTVSLDSEPYSCSVRDSEESVKGAGTPQSGEPERAAENKPLGFRLKSLDPDHPDLSPLGFASETVRRFQAGYCTKGMMVDRLAVPIAGPTGQVLGYVGVGLEEGSLLYPKQFTPELEVYNLDRLEEFVVDEVLIVVGHPLDVWRLYEAGYENAVALLGEGLSDRQETLIISAALPSGKVLLMVPRSERRAEVIDRLPPHVYIRTLDPETDRLYQLAPADVRALLA